MFSNRFMTKVVASYPNSAEMHIPWPTEELGEYGSNTCTDAEMDHWVHKTFDSVINAIGIMDDHVVILDNNMYVLSICAGRNNKLEPVIRLGMKFINVVTRVTLLRETRVGTVNIITSYYKPIGKVGGGGDEGDVVPVFPLTAEDERKYYSGEYHSVECVVLPLCNVALE
jgi:hypothetical protein